MYSSSVARDVMTHQPTVAMLLTRCRRLAVLYHSALVAHTHSVMISP